MGAVFFKNVDGGIDWPRVMPPRDVLDMNVSWAVARPRPGITRYEPAWVEAVVVPGTGRLLVRGQFMSLPALVANYITLGNIALMVAAWTCSECTANAGWLVDFNQMTCKGRKVDLIINFPSDAVGCHLIMPAYVALMGLAFGRKVDTGDLFMGQCIPGTPQGLGLPLSIQDAITEADIEVIRLAPSDQAIKWIFHSIGIVEHVAHEVVKAAYSIQSQSWSMRWGIWWMCCSGSLRYSLLKSLSL